RNRRAVRHGDGGRGVVGPARRQWNVERNLGGDGSSRGDACARRILDRGERRKRRRRTDIDARARRELRQRHFAGRHLRDDGFRRRLLRLRLLNGSGGLRGWLLTLRRGALGHGTRLAIILVLVGPAATEKGGEKAATARTGFLGRGHLDGCAAALARLVG